MQLPARSVLVAGLTALAGWAIETYAFPPLGIIMAGDGLFHAILPLIHIGLSFSPQQVTGAIGALTVAAAHYTPDTLKDTAKALNVDVQKLGQALPALQYDGTKDFPDTQPRNNPFFNQNS